MQVFLQINAFSLQTNRSGHLVLTKRKRLKFLSGFHIKSDPLSRYVRWPTNATAKQKVTAKQISTRGTTK